MGGKNSIKENFYLLLKHAILSVLMFVIYLFISSFSFLGESGKKIENVFSWNYFSIEKHFMLNKRGLKLEITIITSSGMPCWLSDSTNMRTNINIYREKERERESFLNI